MVTVGIDPHKHVHVAVAVDERGNRIGKSLTVKNDGLLIVALITWIRSITDLTSVTWAVEDGRGFARRMADGLLLAGQDVVWVPSRLTAAHRRLHATTGAKSDVIDAVAAAHAAIATPDLPRHHIDQRVRELRVLTDYRSDIVKRRTMMINQLKALSHLWLDHTPGDMARAKALIAFTTRLDTANISTHVRDTIATMIGEIDDANNRIHDLDIRIKELVTPLTPNLLAVTGISHNSAAVLLTEIVDIKRFSSPAKLARYTGCAPIPVFSSDNERHRLHRGGNRRLNSVLHTAAIVQTRYNPAAQQLIARRHDEKGARGARRILKRHLVDVIYRAMHTDQATWQHQINTCERPALT
ncbi:IS110 family RNA-guided transposase [Mycolicibacterium arenosum]|uniref:IS110 family transposase n=1 Tax=Mycolicibacterium arenosum TaxID=2952157 RepID=A0ABT1MCU3_9MYCO|nr:IS110 family transposase [Mycolicibacterium sp. CAU 1645]MCP9276999.1 IS110 family transposase [Mycolicibacterium sp. CAU 1645]